MNKQYPYLFENEGKLSFKDETFYKMGIMYYLNLNDIWTKDNYIIIKCDKQASIKLLINIWA